MPKSCLKLIWNLSLAASKCFYPNLLYSVWSKQFESVIGVDKLWPMVQVWPATCFYMTYKLRMVFTFLNGWQNSKEYYFVACENYMEFRFQHPCKKFYWNTGTLFTSALSVAAFMLQQQCWLVVTEVIWPTKPKIVTLWPSEKKFAGPWSRIVHSNPPLILT